MDVEFTVSLVELKRAFRRLAVTLPDESEAGGELVVFDANHNSLEIVAHGSTEGLSVSVVHPGRASAPFAVFCGIARILRFYRRTKVCIGFSDGVVTIDCTEFRHSSISVLTQRVMKRHHQNKTRKNFRGSRMSSWFRGRLIPIAF
jgi:hypothetical protein